MQSVETRATTDNRAGREKEALRQMWQIIAWGSAATGILVPFTFGVWIGEDASELLFLACLGITAYACYKLGDNVVTSVSMRFNMFIVIVAGLLLFFMTFGVVGLLTIDGVIHSITEWYVKKFP